MPIKVIADSANDMNSELKEHYNINLVPFKLYIDEKEYVDDENIDVNHFITEMEKSPSAPRSACPSPGDFLEHLHGDEDCYLVTISSKLSATFNSAKLAKDMFLEDFSEKFIHVFDSKSASVAETLISMKIHDLYRQNIANIDIVSQVTKYIDDMKTYFVAGSLNNLIKNGRISKFKGAIATLLKIRPIMGADSDGNIQLIEKTKGVDKTFMRLVEIISENAKFVEDKVLAIAHVNNIERAKWLKEEIMKRCAFKEILILPTAALSSMYCDNKGIIVSF